MKSGVLFWLVLLVCVSFFSCVQKNDTQGTYKAKRTNIIKHAKGLKIDDYKGFSVVTVSNAWPGAKENLVYILRKKNTIVPDSLKQYPTITVPIQSIIITSTTHIPALELLGVEKTIVGFPDTDFVSSQKTRKLIDNGLIKNVGKNEALDTEKIIELAPDVVISFGINSNNPAINNLQKSGLNVMFNADWTEQTPLGKAEWIKFFGALYGLNKKANKCFTTIENEYQKTQAIASKAQSNPTVLCGAMYQNQWFVPQGKSWAALFLKEAKVNYLWQNTTGTGSLALPFETVLSKAQLAQLWIAPGDFTSLKQMSNQNPHYKMFQSFQQKKVYSYAKKRGAKGGLLYFELAATRPDLVLKDLIKIAHPELLPEHQLYFFQQLQ